MVMPSHTKSLRRAIGTSRCAQAAGTDRRMGATAVGTLCALSQVRDRAGARTPRGPQSARQAHEAAEATSTYPEATASPTGRLEGRNGPSSSGRGEEARPQANSQALQGMRAMQRAVSSEVQSAEVLPRLQSIQDGEEGAQGEALRVRRLRCCVPTEREREHRRAEAMQRLSTEARGG